MMNKPQYEIVDRVEMPGCQVLTVRGVWAKDGHHWTIVNGTMWIAPSGRAIDEGSVSPNLRAWVGSL